MLVKGDIDFHSSVMQPGRNSGLVRLRGRRAKTKGEGMAALVQGAGDRLGGDDDGVARLVLQQEPKAQFQRRFVMIPDGRSGGRNDGDDREPRPDGRTRNPAYEPSGAGGRRG